MLIGDGITDVTQAFRSELASASSLGETLKLAPGTYRITDWWALWGCGSLVGEHPETTRILIDVPDETKYWGHVGAKDATKGQRVAPWHGEIARIGWYATPRTKAVHLIQFHGAADGWRVERCVFDLRPVKHIPTAMNVFSSHVEHVLYPMCQDGKIVDCYCYADSDVIATGGCGGLNLVLPKRVDVTGCRFYGFADDPLAIIDGEACHVDGNHCSSTRGRLALFGGERCRLRDNHMARIVGYSGQWSNGSDLIACYVAGSRSRAPSKHVIAGNEAYLPDGPTGIHSLLNCGGVRSSVISENILTSNCKTASAVYGIRNGTYDYPLSWMDPHKLDLDGRCRPRDLTFSGNKCVGSRPGTIEEQCPGAPSNMPGPFLYIGNTGKHNVFSPNSRVL